LGSLREGTQTGQPERDLRHAGRPRHGADGAAPLARQRRGRGRVPRPRRGAGTAHRARVQNVR